MEHKRILVVDDDPGVRELLSSVLVEYGLTVDEAEDGEVAIALLREHRYSVVLLDLLMPKVDGFAVLEALERETEDLPVVLVITGAERATIAQLDSQRIHGIVRKPFDVQELGSLVSACAEIRGRSAFETMAIATIVAGGPLLALLNRFAG
jgi:CheY-like chemotaxis protein